MWFCPKPLLLPHDLQVDGDQITLSSKNTNNRSGTPTCCVVCKYKCGDEDKSQAIIAR